MGNVEYCRDGGAALEHFLMFLEMPCIPKGCLFLEVAFLPWLPQDKPKTILRTLMN